MNSQEEICLPPHSSYFLAKVEDLHRECCILGGDSKNNIAARRSQQRTPQYAGVLLTPKGEDIVPSISR
jgi:hypothetical protein